MLSVAAIKTPVLTVEDDGTATTAWVINNDPGSDTTSTPRIFRCWAAPTIASGHLAKCDAKNGLGSWAHNVDIGLGACDRSAAARRCLFEIVSNRFGRSIATRHCTVDARTRCWSSPSAVGSGASADL